MLLDITSNYSDTNGAFGGIGSYSYFLDGKTGAETIPISKNAISKLSDDVDKDYWKATEENAKRVLLRLLTLVQMRPDGVWLVY